MSRFLTLLILSLITGFAVKAQTDTAAYYMLDENNAALTRESAKFIRVAIFPHNRKNNQLFNISDYYLSGKIKLRATSFSTESFYSGLEGPMIKYYENGHRQFVGGYKNGRPNGEHLEYYPNGLIYTIKDYDGNGYSFYLKECRDSTGKILAEKGNGDWIKFDEEFKHIVEKGKVTNGDVQVTWSDLTQGLSTLTIPLAADVRGDTLIYYMNNETALARIKDSVKFIRKIALQSTGKILYHIEDVYLNGQVKREATSTIADAAFQRGLTGECSEYYENGNKKSVVHYKEGEKAGNAALYYPNGKIHTIKNYDDKGQIVLTECRDSIGKVIAENGNGMWIEYDKDFRKIIMQGNVVKGLQDGEWHGTFESTIDHTYTFSNGKFISQNPAPSNMDLIPQDRDVQARYPEGIEKFYSFIGHNLHYPNVARVNDVTGKVYLGFVVEKDGTITNIKVIRGIGSGCDEEAVRVLKLMPKWSNGGQLYGVPVRLQYNIPISFSIAPEEVIYLK